MAYDEKTLKRDGSGITPVPQHFNPIADDYEPIYGRNNAGRVELYGPDGNPISTDDSNKLAVRASEIETILNEIKSKDFATQTTLAAILAKLIAAPATEAKQDALAALIGEVDADPTANTLLARIKSLEDKIDAIIDGSAPAVTQLSGSIIADETDKAATANTDILTDIIATKTEMTTLMVATNTGGILNLEVDGSLNSLNGGVALTAGQWYAFDIPVLAASVYNLQITVDATMQIKWMGGF